MPAKAKKQDDADITFEDAAEKLETIVEAMESEELPLGEAARAIRGGHEVG